MRKRIIVRSAYHDPERQMRALVGCLDRDSKTIDNILSESIWADIEINTFRILRGVEVYLGRSYD